MVAIALPKSLAWVVWFAACVRVMAVVVPFRSYGSRESFQRGMSRLRPAHYVCSLGQYGQIDPEQIVATFQPSNQEAVCCRISDRIRNSAVRVFVSDYREQGESVVYLNPTSGTTGEPKYAVTTNANLYWNTVSAIDGLGLTSHCISMCLFPPHMHPHEFIYRPVFLGGTMVLCPEFDPRSIVEYARRHRVNHLMATPAQLLSLIDYMCTAGMPVLDDIELVESGGAISPPKLTEMSATVLGGQFISVWGSTETAGIVLSTYGMTPEPMMLGRPHKYYDVRVRNRSEKSKPGMGSGEMTVSGPGVTSVVIDVDGETLETELVQGTGDIVKIDASGIYRYEGREDRFISIAGEKVAAGEIESAILDHPSVSECAVVARPHRTKGQCPYAFVRVEPPSSVDAKVIRRFCAKTLQAHKIPKHISFIDEMPVTENGKLDYVELQRLVAKRG